MRVCHLIGAGDFAGGQFCPEKGDFVIACDAGLRRLKEVGAAPDLIVGDFDSYADELPAGVPVVRLACEKDDTDMEHAAAEGLARGYDAFLLHGALGGERFSHSFANLALCASLADKGVAAAIAAPGAAMAVLGQGSYTLPPAAGYLSLFAYGEPCRLRAKGLKYPFDGVLAPDMPLGVSNEMRGEGKIEVLSGKLLLVYEGGELSAGELLDAVKN